MEYILHMLKDKIADDIMICNKAIDNSDMSDDDKDMIKSHLDMFLILLSKEPLENDNL